MESPVDRRATYARMTSQLARVALSVVASASLAAAEKETDAVDIRDYRVLTGVAHGPDMAGLWVVLRAFVSTGTPSYLVVDTASLRTRAVPADHVAFEPRVWSSVRVDIAETPYGRLLTTAERHGGPLQDAGLTHVPARRSGIELTVDLCPSQRPLDRELFSALVVELARHDKPVPVAIAVTGTWLETHPRDLSWLNSLEQAGGLSLTWINHSFHHRVSRTVPLRRNFMLEPGTDVDAEVLNTERMLLTHGLIPSVFFRFPGLISTAALVERIVGFGLVPLGSDAWLAKNQWPTEGSIVLVHANGNEPVGIQRFLQLLRTERAAIRAGRWQLLDLRESVVSVPPR